MKRVFLTIAACSSFCIAISQSVQTEKEVKQYEWTDRNNNTIYHSDSITKKGFTLIFLVQDSAFNPVTRQKLTDAFFTVYPQEVKRFNKNAIKKIVFIIDPSYDGVAAAS